MSLYAAEAHARTTREEVLLSRLFGTLEIVDREAYLGEILRQAKVEIPAREIASTQIQFWPELGHGSPDVILESDSLLLFVVGWDPGRFDKRKLHLLVENGWKLSPRFNLLLISDGNAAPPEVEELNQDLPGHREAPFRWVGWRSIYRTLYQSLRERKEEAPAKELVNDLLGLLAAEGRAPFIGFHDAVLRDYRESLPAIDRLQTSVRLLLSDLERHLQGSGIQRISPRDGKDEDMPWQAPRVLHQEYADESWDPRLLSVGGLFLRVDYVVGEVRVGFKSNLHDPSAKALLVEGRSRIAEDLHEKEEILLRLVGEEGKEEPCKDASLLARLETLNGAASINGVELLSVFDGARDDLVPFLAESLTTFRDLADSIPLLPLHRYSGESPFVIAGAR
ncbi:MAG: hypothetical protein JW958_06425 [Candidatus Eisenbacteria bacterium]|nr:hypothetical protein [Candidatus Eisenbacteria bacterium]